jgi:polyisoprenoid-binding protein YceI
MFRPEPARHNKSDRQFTGEEIEKMSTTPARRKTTTTWNLEAAHSVAEFKVKHMMISNVKGQFTASPAY